MSEQTESVDSISRQFAAAFPSVVDRRVVLEELARTIAVAEETAPGAWSVTNLGDGYRVNTGAVEALIALPDSLHVNLAGSAKELKAISRDIGKAGYDVIDCFAWTGTPAEFAELSSRLRPYHHEFLRQALTRKDGTPRAGTSWKKSHSEALVAYARGVAGGRESEVKESAAEVEWRDFLNAWPIERLRSMSLEQFAKAGDRDTFTYWLEYRTKGLGEIGGGTAYTHGIFERDSTSGKPPSLRAQYAHDERYSWFSKYGSTAAEAFEAIRTGVERTAEFARAGQFAEIDTGRLGPTYRWKIAFLYQPRERPGVVAVYNGKLLREFLGVADDNGPPTASLYAAVLRHRRPDETIVKFSQRVWRGGAPGDDHHVSSPHGPRNIIFYGPPGTGKTHETVVQAVELVDPAFARAHTDRPSLKGRFDELVRDGSIHLVTFHQSLSYEDFVEGISAETDEATQQVRYRVVDGIFKRLCDTARARVVQGSAVSIDPSARRIWKMSLGEAIDEQIFDECIDKGLALIGFGGLGDFAGVASREDVIREMERAGHRVEPNDYAVTALHSFAVQMQKGDLIVVTEGNLKFRAIGEVTGDYRRIEREIPDTFNHSRPVRWLRVYRPALPYEALMENRFSQMTIYRLKPGSINLDKFRALLRVDGDDASAPQPKVLIIDEINRGNVSRIFGELITLIEPSKRAGSPEALEAVLPYSKERFSVPANVHLVGTMNTADRSLAGLDIALRRRFEFVEMPPKPALLEGIEVDGVSIERLLETMNRRIEALLDRDHMLGHAYFMLLEEEPTLTRLAGIFRNQIVPLLQEYFFEDWQRIAWVLNDHRKPDGFRFVVKPSFNAQSLFGAAVDVPADPKLWRVDPKAFGHIESYRGIIDAT